MRRTILIVIMLTSLSMTGCAWFVPGSIKNETSLVRTDLETCIAEAKVLRQQADDQRALAAETAKTDVVAANALTIKAAEFDRQAYDKVMRSYNRVLPHVVNLEDYMFRKASQ